MILACTRQKTMLRPSKKTISDYHQKSSQQQLADWIRTFHAVLSERIDKKNRHAKQIAAQLKIEDIKGTDLWLLFEEIAAALA